MPREGLASTLVAAVLVVSWLSGCRSTGDVVSVELRAAEKDVLVWDVELDGPRAAEQYLDWAEASLEARGRELENPYFGFPVYEVLYSFRQGRRQLATVLYRRTDPSKDDPSRSDPSRSDPSRNAAGPLVHVRTLVYHGDDGELP